jgi:hypothetical protein
MCFTNRFQPDHDDVELMRDGGVEEAIELRVLIASFAAGAGVLVEPRDRVVGTAWPRPETFGACPCSCHLGDRRYWSDVGVDKVSHTGCGSAFEGRLKLKGEHAGI